MTIAAPNLENRTLALCLRLGGVSCLSAMVVLIKLASDRGVALGEIIFWRQFLAIPVALGWVLGSGGIASLKTDRFGAHVTRSVMGLTSMALNFGAIVLLPLAESTTLGFAVPIFATILAALLLNERIGIHRASAVALGFVGVLIVVQPGSGAVPLTGALVGLGAAFMIALTTLQLRDMGRTEPAPTTVFWFSVLASVPTAALLPLFFSAHDSAEWLLLIGIGVLGGCGQIGLTGALKMAPVSVVMPMDYVALLWSTLFGWLVWHTVPGPTTGIGAAVIIASSAYIGIREHRLNVERSKEIAA